MVDIMGNYTGFESAFVPTSPYDEEEERRRREREQLNKPVKTTIVTNPDGTQEMTVKGTPQALSSANPRTPTVVAPVAPGAPAPQGGMTQDQYNAYIAQNESGNRPDIGYHMPGKSSAYGTYGITNAAYQDVQRAAPQFAGRPITSLTPQEQTQAQDVYTKQNTRYLQNYGVEPTQGNLALAHFLGARGAADYIKTGAISPAAAAANGGEERVRQIAQQRLALGQAPVSGAAQPPAQPAPVAPGAPAAQPQTAMPNQGMVQIDDQGNKMVTTSTGETFVVGPDNKPLPARGVDLTQASFGGRFLAAQNDNDALAALAGDKTAPTFERQLAKDIFVERYEQNKLEAKAREAMANAAQTGNFNQVSREMKSGSSIGDWLKYMFFKSNGFNEAATEAADRLGLTDSYQQVSLPNGQPAVVRFGYNGLAKQGKDFNGNTLTQEQLDMFAGMGGATMAKAETGKTLFRDPTGQIPGIITATYVPGQTTPIYTNQQGQRVRPTSLTPITAATDVQSAYQTGYARAGGTAQGTQTAEGFTPSTLAPAPGIAGVPGTAQAPAPATAVPPQPVPQTTVTPSGGVPPQSVGGVVSALPATASARPPAPVAGPAVPGTAPGAPVYQQKQNVEITGKDREAFVKYTNEDLLPKADAGSKLAGIRRDQIYGPDGVLNNPEIAGLLSGTGSSAREFQNLFRDIVAGNFKDEPDMSARIKAAGLDNRLKEVLQIQLQRQREVTPLMIREVAPVGTITDFEQRMAKDAGIDVLRQGLYSSLTNMTRSAYQSDLAAYKAVFKSNNPQLQTREQFESAWQQEKARLDAVYRRVYEDRAQYLGKYNKDGNNNNATVVAFRDHYPVPQFNQESKQWEFKGYSRNALKPKLKEFER